MLPRLQFGEFAKCNCLSGLINNLTRAIWRWTEKKWFQQRAWNDLNGASNSLQEGTRFRMLRALFRTLAHSKCIFQRDPKVDSLRMTGPSWRACFWSLHFVRCAEALQAAMCAKCQAWSYFSTNSTVAGILNCRAGQIKFKLPLGDPYSPRSGAVRKTNNGKGCHNQDKKVQGLKLIWFFIFTNKPQDGGEES